MNPIMDALPLLIDVAMRTPLKSLTTNKLQTWINAIPKLSLNGEDAEELLTDVLVAGDRAGFASLGAVLTPASLIKNFQLVKKWKDRLVQPEATPAVTIIKCEACGFFNTFENGQRVPEVING